MKKLTLTSEQKEDLKNLKRQPWFKILEMIHEQVTYDLGKKLLNCSLNEKDIEIIKRNQDYLKAREDFFNDIEKHLNSVYTPKI